MPGRKAISSVKKHRRRPQYRRRYRGFKTAKRTRNYIGKRIPYALPAVVNTKLTYAMNGRILAGGAGLLGYHIFRGNDISDPDQSGVGHQAFMNDTFANLYDKVCVYGSKIMVEVMSANPSINGIKCLLRARKSSVVPTDGELEEERKHAVHRLIATDGKKVSFNMYNSTARMYGLSKYQVLTDDLFKAATSTSATSLPSNTWNWTLSCVGMDTTQTADVFFNVKLTYYVQYSERIPQVKS